MDLNLPLLLMIAVAVTGVLWLIDALLWSRPRRAAVAAVESQYAELSEPERQRNEHYHLALAQAKKEPLAVEYAKSFFPLLAFVFVLRSFLVEPFQIPSESMVPTLQVGDFIAVNKFAYGIRLPVFGTKIIPVGEPKRGDVVVHFPPHINRYFIKRLVGLPGDTVRYVDNRLFVNGEEVPQEFLYYDEQDSLVAGCWTQFAVYREVLGGHEYQARKCMQPGRLSRDGTWVVPPGHYFMMGDNRDNSLDSRAWPDPFVPDKNIVGKAFAIWMHWDTGLPSFGRVGLIE